MNAEITSIPSVQPVEATQGGMRIPSLNLEKTQAALEFVPNIRKGKEVTKRKPKLPFRIKDTPKAHSEEDEETNPKQELRVLEEVLQELKSIQTSSDEVTPTPTTPLAIDDEKPDATIKQTSKVKKASDNNIKKKIQVKGPLLLSLAINSLPDNPVAIQFASDLLSEQKTQIEEYIKSPFKFARRPSISPIKLIMALLFL